MFKKLLLIVLLCVWFGGFSNAQSWKKLDSLGIIAYNNAKYVEAVVYFEQSISLILGDVINDSDAYVYELSWLASSYQGIGKYKKADTLFLEALALNKTFYGSNSLAHLQCLNNLGYLKQEMGDYPRAESFFLEAIDIAKSTKEENSWQYSNTTYGLGSLFFTLKRYKLAEKLFREYLEIEERTNGKDNERYKNGLLFLGGVYCQLDQYKKADSCFVQTMDLYKRYNNKLGVDYANIIHYFVGNRVQMGVFAEVESLYLQVIAIYKRELGENNATYASALGNFASFYEKTGDYFKAEQLYIRTSEILRDLTGKKSSEYLHSMARLGFFYFLLGNYDLSERLQLESLEGLRELNLPNDSYEYILADLVILYLAKEDYVQAETLALKATEISKTVGGEESYAYACSLHNLGSVYVALMNYEKALVYDLLAIEIEKKTVGPEHPTYANSLLNVALLYIYTGEYALAENLFLQALAIQKNLYGETHPIYTKTLVDNVANSYEWMGRHDEAVKYKLLGFPLLVNQLKTQAAFLSGKELDKYVQSVNEEFPRLHSLVWRTITGYDELKRLDYNSLLFINGFQLRNALSMSISAKNENDTAITHRLDQWIALKRRMANEYVQPVLNRDPNLLIWEDEANKLEKKLKASSGKFQKDLFAQTTTINDISGCLKPYEASVEFVSFHYYRGKGWTDSTLYMAMLLLPNDSFPICVPLFEEKQLKGLFNGDSLRTFSNLLYTDAQIRTEEHDISYGDSLYQLVWKPLEPYLKDISQIYYAPSGMLHGITFDAIPVSNNKVLSDQYKLQRLTSTGKIIEMDSNAFIPSTISLFGGIIYNIDELELRKMASNRRIDDYFIHFSSTRSSEDTTYRSGFNYLPGSKLEVENIQKIFKNNKIATHIYSSQGASEECVKNLDGKNSPSILHFSTHGFFFPNQISKNENLNQRALDHDIAFKYSDNPLFRCGLIMAGAEYVWKGNPPIEGVEDGILTASEVSNLYLPNTKLVVLSACETGLGDVKGSEGVYGLQRAFKMAGVDYIIMTLWKVLDKETSDFMTLFYQNLLEMKSIPNAFIATQDTMKNKYRDEPYKWAGFVLIK